MRLPSLLSHTHALPTYAAPHRACRAFSPTMVEVEEPEEPPPPAEPLPILLQTDSYIFIAKPAGTVVHRGKFTKKGEVPLMQRLRDQLACLRAKQNTVRAGPLPHLDLPSFPNRWMPMAGTERSQEGQACQAWYRGRRWLEVSQACGA